MAAAPLIVPRRVLGGSDYQVPSDTLNIAGVGVGGVEARNLRLLSRGQENIVALADVDHKYARDTFNEYPQAERYYDYRRMFDEMGDQIDGVVIATPDHTHAVIAMEAMERGLPVYVQKPLTHSVAEARGLAKIAERTGVITQMGNQGHSSDDARLINEYIREGAIGEVRRVHAWTNRPVWPQGMGWPGDFKRKPPNLDWNGFLGPAPKVKYDPSFHPFKWRGWVDWGTGALGDMGAHIIEA
jgi:predicted dehydrogenase